MTLKLLFGRHELDSDPLKRMDLCQKLFKFSFFSMPTVRQALGTKCR
jgi:hypothetical protein